MFVHLQFAFMYPDERARFAFSFTIPEELLRAHRLLDLLQKAWLENIIECAREQEDEFLAPLLFAASSSWVLDLSVPPKSLSERSKETRIAVAKQISKKIIDALKDGKIEDAKRFFASYALEISSALWKKAEGFDEIIQENLRLMRALDRFFNPTEKRDFLDTRAYRCSNNSPIVIPIYAIPSSPGSAPSSNGSPVILNLTSLMPTRYPDLFSRVSTAADHLLPEKKQAGKFIDPSLESTKQLIKSPPASLGNIIKCRLERLRETLKESLKVRKDAILQQRLFIANNLLMRLEGGASTTDKPWLEDLFKLDGTWKISENGFFRAIESTPNALAFMLDCLRAQICDAMGLLLNKINGGFEIVDDGAAPLEDLIGKIREGYELVQPPAPSDPDEEFVLVTSAAAPAGPSRAAVSARPH